MLPVHHLNVYPVLVASWIVNAGVSYVYVDGLFELLLPPFRWYEILYVFNDQCAFNVLSVAGTEYGNDTFWSPSYHPVNVYPVLVGFGVGA